MHELSIAVALIEQVEEAVAAENGIRASCVTVSVGALSGVDCEALELAFPVAAEGTIVQGARLVMNQVEARVRCKSCEAETVPDFPFFFCETCGSTDIEFLSGRELLLQSIEMTIETEEPSTV